MQLYEPKLFRCLVQTATAESAKMVKAVDGALGATVFTPGEKLCGKHVRAQVGHVNWVQDIKESMYDTYRGKDEEGDAHAHTNKPTYLNAYVILQTLFIPTYTLTNQPYHPFIPTNILVPILYAALKLCNGIACVC